MTQPKKPTFQSPSHTKTRSNNALLDASKQVNEALDNGTREIRVPIGLATEIMDGLQRAGWVVDMPDISLQGAQLLVACESDPIDWLTFVKEGAARRTAAKATTAATETSSEDRPS